jgi:hypothetical protein
MLILSDHPLGDFVVRCDPDWLCMVPGCRNEVFFDGLWKGNCSLLDNVGPLLRKSSFGFMVSGT